MPNITVPAKDGGSFDAYIAIPETTPTGSVIIIQEIFGINQGIREKCDWLASEGFIACAPDLFWRIEPGIELSDQIPEELERAFQLFGEFDIDKGIEDLKATYHTLKGHADGNGKVGCLGYCLGGKLAYLMACKSDVDVSVGYYGVGIEGMLDKAQNIQNPLALHIACEDGFVPPEAQAAIHGEFDSNSLITLYDYQKMDHAFTRVGGDNYNEQAAQLADTRSIDFLRQNLV